MTEGLRQVPPTHPSDVEHRRQIAQTLNAVIRDEGLPARYDALVVPALAMTPATSAPGLVAISGAVQTYGFDASATESLLFSIALPHGVAEGGPIIPHVRWMASAGATGTVAWGLDYSLCALSASAVTAASGPLTASAQGSAHRVTALATMTGMAAISTIIVGRLYRAGGTLAGDALLLGLDFLVQIDARGSQDEYDKYIGV